MPKPVTTLRQLISYLRAIPAKKWRTGGRSPDKEGRCCAMGWVEKLYVNERFQNANKLIASFGMTHGDIEELNDASHIEDDQLSPLLKMYVDISRSSKVRVLTYLKSKLS